MRNSIIYALLVLLGLNFQSCRGQNKDKGMRTIYSWDPSVARPKNYPVEIKYGYVGFGNKGDRFPIMDPFATAGIGTPGGGIGLNDYNVEKGIPVPNSLEILWVSYTEKKFYKVHYDFPAELQDKILSLFRQEFYDSADSTYYRYDNLVLSLLPHGVIWLHLTGAGRYVSLDYAIQAQEIKMDIADFTKTRHKTLEEFCDGRLSDYPWAVTNLEKNGIPAYSFWERYAERFRYDIKIEFEDSLALLDPDYGYEFANGEYFRNTDQVSVESLARIKLLIMVWYVGDVKYTGHFYFNEDEVFELFDKAYGKNREQKGEFVIRVSKYNNWFDVLLRVGEQNFKFDTLHKTQIHVFRRRPEDDRGYNFYDNYRGKEIEHYVGE